MAKLKKISVLSFVKLQAVMGGLIGLLAGILYSFGGLLIDSLVTFGWITSSETPGLSYGTVLAFGALLGMPAIGVIFGLIAGFIGAILYNLVAKRFGGMGIVFK